MRVCTSPVGRLVCSLHQRLGEADHVCRDHITQDVGRMHSCGSHFPFRASEPILCCSVMGDARLVTKSFLDKRAMKSYERRPGTNFQKPYFRGVRRALTRKIIRNDACGG